MTRVLMLMLGLLSGSVAAQPRAGTEEAGVGPDASGRPSLWVQPVLPFMGLALTTLSGQRYFGLPVGWNQPVRPTRDLVFELTPLVMPHALSLYAAVGHAWRLRPDASGGGLFLHLKGGGALSAETRDVVPGRSPWGAQASLGLDVGYRFQHGRFFLDMLLGLNAGVSFGFSSPLSSLGVGLYAPLTREGTRWLFVEPNLHLLRLGVRL